MSPFVIFLLLVIAAAFSLLIYFYGFDVSGLDEATVTINGTTFLVEVADTPLEKSRGLSGRESLSENQGMLFVFSEPGEYGFWMKEMKFPIDIVWVRGSGIVGFSKNLPPAEDQSPEIYYPPQPVDKVLELPAGLVDKHQWGIGASVTVEIK